VNPPKTQLLDALRAGTTHLHRRLDNAVSRQPFATRSGYGRFLLMHVRVLPSAERWLVRTAAFKSLPQFADRLRSAALLQDLEDLGLAVPEERDMSFLNDGLSAAGICYVLEGSRLGSAHLCSVLHKSGTDFPTAFLRHGAGCGFWRSFLDWLAKQDESPAAAERAVRSAQQLFEAYLVALEEQDDNRKQSVGKS